ncbi:MAG: DNA (cytosine-5-)-methyltransferase [Deltaproteobacteria bacterium]|nr:DNA (cytosine-5-)-methyltransferase [Deltaproteobacteria bacterium]
MTTRSAKKADLYGQFDSVLDAVLSGISPVPQVNQKLKTYIDLFCGIGGFHIAASNLDLKCVFACDIDEEARKAYSHNFGINPHGDIIGIAAKNVPDHDLLCAGFPCQPFSIIGSQKGFSDPRGTLFFEIARIIKEKQPKAVVLENVRQLASVNKGKTLQTIKETLEQLGYYVDFRILNALDFGVPQKRERVLIVATRRDIGKFPWPSSVIPMKPLSDILEKNPDQKHFVSGKIKRARKEAHSSEITPSIWHENKSGNISSHPFSCALRAGASYNYLLVDGERRLTPREMLRLQGFPDTFEIVCNDSQTRKQAGNAVPVPMIQSVLESLINVYR